MFEPICRLYICFVFSFVLGMKNPWTSVVNGGSGLPISQNKKAHGYYRERSAFSLGLRNCPDFRSPWKAKTLLYYMFIFLFYSFTVLILIIGFIFCFIYRCKDTEFLGRGDKVFERYVITIPSKMKMTEGWL